MVLPDMKFLFWPVLNMEFGLFRPVVVFLLKKFGVVLLAFVFVLVVAKKELARGRVGPGRGLLEGKKTLVGLEVCMVEDRCGVE